MNAEEFEKAFERQVALSREVLLQKAKEYASDEDRMHNFKAAAALTGGTPEQALWGFLVKHLISISDMVKSAQSYPEEKWDEKVGDALNYLFLLRALVTDTDYVVNSPIVFNQYITNANEEAKSHLSGFDPA